MAADQITLTLPRQGWQCPVCGRGVSPDQFTCDHGNAALPAASPVALPINSPTVIPFPPTTAPVEDPWWNRRGTGDPYPTDGVVWSAGCEACRHSGICMCVRPSPHDPRLTGTCTDIAQGLHTFTISAASGSKK